MSPGPLQEDCAPGFDPRQTGHCRRVTYSALLEELSPLAFRASAPGDTLSYQPKWDFERPSCQSRSMTGTRPPVTPLCSDKTRYDEATQWIFHKFEINAYVKHCVLLSKSLRLSG